MWLMKKSLAEAIEHARSQALQAPKSVTEAFERSFAAGAPGEPRIFKRAGDVAQIDVVGTLTPRPDFYAYWYGGGNTTYPEIIQSLALAAADSSVKRVVLNVCSPGGYVAGLFDVLGALEAFTKPKETRASQADSAAYAIAALGGKITAPNKAAEFGSVGVCATYVRYDGENIYEITSSNAPNKRPDPSTPEGQKVIREELDAIEELFIDAIARGRKTTVKDVTKNFGRGGVFLAEGALEAGMIDAIADSAVRVESGGDSGEPGDTEEEVRRSSSAATPSLAVAPSVAATAAEPKPLAAAAPPAPAAPAPTQDAPAASGGAPRKTTKMDEAQLQAEHPGLYAVVFNKGKAEGEKGKAEAVSTALADEKDRVEAHLVMGETSGDMKLAVESVRGGAKMTQTLTAKYMAAGMNKGSRDARTEDDAVAAAATGGAVPGDKPAKALKERVADAVAAQHEGGAAA